MKGKFEAKIRNKHVDNLKKIYTKAENVMHLGMRRMYNEWKESVKR